jgi:hypothetical protein
MQNGTTPSTITMDPSARNLCTHSEWEVYYVKCNGRCAVIKAPKDSALNPSVAKEYKILSDLKRVAHSRGVHVLALVTNWRNGCDALVLERGTYTLSSYLKFHKNRLGEKLKLKAISSVLLGLQALHELQYVW